MKLPLICSGALLVALPAMAQSYENGPVHVMSPWSRAVPPVSKHGAAYLTLRNHGDVAARLTGASSPVADSVEVHTHELEDGMMVMRRAEFVVISPAEYVNFEPGGNHFMLIGLKKPLKPGDHFPLILRFENASAIEVMVKVLAMDADEPAAGDHGSHMHHGEQQTHGHKTP